MKYLISLFMLFIVACGGGSSSVVNEPDPPTTIEPYELPTQFEYSFDGYSGIGVRIDDYIYFSNKYTANTDRTVTARAKIVERDEEGNISIEFDAFSFLGWNLQESNYFELDRSGSNWSDGVFHMTQVSSIETVAISSTIENSSDSSIFGEPTLTVDSNLGGFDSRGCTISTSLNGFKAVSTVANCDYGGEYIGAYFKIGSKARLVIFYENLAISGYFDIVNL